MKTTLLSFFAFLVLAAPLAQASDQVGVYGKIAKVQITPAAGNVPATIKIWGTFAMAMGLQGTQGFYTQPTYGYLYYRAETDPQKALEQWEKIKGAAGTDQCVGFGQRNSDNGTLRQGHWPIVAIDEYPLNNTVKVAAKEDRECAKFSGPVLPQ